MNPITYRKPSYDTWCFGPSTSVWTMSSFFFALVLDALFTGARLTFSSAHVSQCPLLSIRMCIPATSSLAKPHHWSCYVPVPCSPAPGFCFALHGCPTRVTNPCALHVHVQCLGDVPQGVLFVQGYTQKEQREECIGQHWYKPKEEASRLVSWCWPPSQSWPLHLARLDFLLKSGCGCRWVPRMTASARAHTSCPCCPAPHIVLCLYLPLVFDSC